MAEEDEEEGTEGEGGAEAPEGKKKSKLLLIIIVAVVLLLGGGGAAFFLMSGGDTPEGEEVEEKQVTITYGTVEMKPFIINLADNRSYLKTILLLEYEPTLVGELPEQDEEAPVSPNSGERAPLAGNLPGKLRVREPMIRDAVLTLISNKRREDLISSEGKEILKEELLEVINDAGGLEDAAIIAVYFIDFIIQ
jgi:flagellar FliL protein